MGRILEIIRQDGDFRLRYLSAQPHGPDGRFKIPNDLTFRYGLRIGDSHMQSLARFGVTAEDLFASDRSLRYLGRLLPSLFNLNDFMAFRAKAQPLLRDVWLSHEDMELMAGRDREGTCDGLFVACWGGHNGQSHNNNDVGNWFMVKRI